MRAECTPVSAEVTSTGENYVASVKESIQAVLAEPDLLARGRWIVERPEDAKRLIISKPNALHLGIVF